MPVSLPQNDPETERRQKHLDRARGDYQFRFDYHDIVAAKSLPLHEKADPAWWAGVARAGAELTANKIAVDLKGKFAKGDAVDYTRMYATIDAPSITSVWQRDDIFAWQALAGTNPVMLKRLTKKMSRFPVSNTLFQRAIGTHDKFDTALAEGRLYVADYAVLDGLDAGTVDGLQKYNFAPIAMYVWDPTVKELRPVAIQVAQKKGSPIFCPQDGISWQMARRVVSTADGNYQGILSHFALCHQVMESVILSARRQLADVHPLLILLSPHFRDTLITNDIAMSNLIGPGGYMERLQSPTLDASLELAVSQINEFELTESAPRKDFARRGVDDLAALGDYPARDDALLVWDATLPFVKSYVELYYTSDADVAGDVELAAWVDEMGSKQGGRLKNIARPATVADVVDLVAQIIFRCTCYHASINYSSFPLFSYTPNMQAAAFGPGPVGGDADTEAAYNAMLPPFDQAMSGLWLFYEIYDIQLNQLGGYPTFSDPRVGPILGAYQLRLADVETQIALRNTTRKLIYPYMQPSRVSLSIHV